mgnify:CR=1 FL=1
MSIFRSGLLIVIAVMGLLQAPGSHAGEYLVDTSGAHACVNFKFDHLGIGRITGGFRKFSGSFFYDPENVEISWVEVEIEMASLDSNQATRDRNIRSSFFA